MAKIIDLDIELPVIVREQSPNTVTIGTPVVTYASSNIIEVETTFSSDVDYVGGISINETGATYIDNPQYMSKMFTGLTPATKYTFNGVGLPVMGEKTYGPLIEVWTSASPIPPEYQLVEWGQPSAVNLYVITSDYTYAILNLGAIKYEMTPLQNAGRGQLMFGDSLVYRHFTLSNTMYFDVNGSVRIQLSIAQYLNAKAEWEVGNNFIKRNGITIASGAVSSSINETSNFYWFQEPHRFGWGELTDKNGEYMHRLFPVYLKSDTTQTGWYDIIHYQFYPQQWSAQGPDKEWEG